MDSLRSRASRADYTSTPASTPQRAAADTATHPIQAVGAAISAAATAAVQALQDVSTTQSVREADFEPGDFKMGQTPAAEGPAILKEPYNTLQQSLKSNPNIGYFELDRKSVNAGLSKFLAGFQTELANRPELRQKLEQSPLGRDLLAALDNAAKGQLSTEDILKLQTFVVASGGDIRHANSSTGIDGDYGPRTHEGLQKAFSQLLADPDAVVQGLADESRESIQKAYTGANNRRQALNESGDAYIPGQSRTVDDTAPGVDLGSSPMPVAGANGREIADAARRTASSFRNPKTGAIPSVGFCMGGVRTALDSIGIQLRAPGGGYIQSAKDADEAIMRQYGDRFQKMELDPNDPNFASRMRSLPAGAIVVWEANPDPSTHSRGGGFKHGHISVALGNGYEASDHIQPQITNANGRYGRPTIFIPREAAASQ